LTAVDACYAFWVASRIEGILGSVSISDLPRRRVCRVGPQTSLGQVYELLDTERSVAVLIEDEGRLVGIFTERDVLNRTVLEGGLEKPIGELMTSDPVTLGDGQHVAEAISLMTGERIRHVPLVDAKGRDRGMIGGRDVLRLIADYYPETLLNLPPRLNQKMTRSEGG